MTLTFWPVDPKMVMQVKVAVPNFSFLSPPVTELQAVTAESDKQADKCVIPRNKVLM